MPERLARERAGVLRRFACILLLVVGCEEPAPDAPVAPPEVEAAHVPDAARGRALIERFECARCHTGPLLAEVSEERSCVGCHQSILSGEFDAPSAELRRWQHALVSLNHAPALGGRLRPDWIVAFLQNPHDVRPGLPATMPRLPIAPEQAQDIAAALTEGAPTDDEEATAGDPAPGLALLEARCTSCHAYGGVLDAEPAGEGAPIALAPDLRHTRARMSRAAILRWLADPGPLMPNPNLSDAEAAQVADALLHAPLAEPPPAALPERLPVLDRPVRFDEVAERVLSQTCWHCHADPDFAMGDGGAGNTGGFGYPGRGVNLLDYAGVSSGYVADDGERRSMFAEDEDGTPHLVRVLMARHAEEAGEPLDGVTGMPLGLPALPLEDIQLVETWIAQGRPN